MLDLPKKQSDGIQQEHIPQQLKPYHTPRIENYGAVNELTRSGGSQINNSDGPDSYTSIGQYEP